MLVQLPLPLRDPEGRPFPREEFERVRQLLAQRHGGVTSYLRSPASGLWKDEPAAPPTADELVLFEVMVDPLDGPEWAILRRTSEQRFRQESILVRAVPGERL